MKITGTGTIASSSGTSKKRGVSSAGEFAELLASAEASDVEQTAPTGDVTATALTNLLALQEISEEEVKRKKLVQQGNNMLDVLETLRRRLLIGSLSPQVLMDIGHQISIQKQMTDDPQLNLIIEDIELRAAVELAKLQQALAKEPE